MSAVASVLFGASLTGFLVLAVLLIGRARRHRRLHRPRANKFFLAGYHAAYRQFHSPSGSSPRGKHAA